MKFLIECANEFCFFWNNSPNERKNNDLKMCVFLFQSTDEKDKENSTYEVNNMKKDEPTTTNGVLNGIDDDKGFK